MAALSRVDVQAYDELLGFVHVLNEAVVGKKLTDTFPSYPVSVNCHTVYLLKIRHLIIRHLERRNTSV